MNKYIQKRKVNRPTLIASSIAIALASITHVAMAAEEEAEKESGIERIVVSSQKRVTNLQEVPISVAAMNADAIDQTGIREIQEMDEYIPNLQISDNSSYNTVITIRGVGSSSRNIGFDSRVGIYVDDVYMGQSAASNQDILDVERIEVLRGPQGTLFGKNNVAGAISIITKEPENEFSGKVRLDVGNMSSRRLGADINIPLSDNTSAKISVNKQTRDGFIHNIPTGDMIGEQDGTSYRLQLKSQLSDNLTAKLTLDGLDTERKVYTGGAYASRAGGVLANPSQEFTALNNVAPTEDRELDGSALHLVWDLDNGAQIKSITAKRDTYVNYINDLDNGVSYVAGEIAPGVPIGFFFGITGEVELDYTDEYSQVSQELQYISPAEGNFQYVTGLYYYDQEGKTHRRSVGHHDPSHPFYAGGILEYPGDDFYPVDTRGVVNTKSYAVYFNGTYDFSDQFTLGLGARYTAEKKDVDWTSDPSNAAKDVVGAGVDLNAAFKFYNGSYVDNYKDKNFSPEFSLQYAVSDETNVYYRASSGFKSGGFNVDFITSTQFALGLKFDKETVFSHEIGIKGSALDRNVTYNIALFDATYDDYQVQQFVEDKDAVAGAAVIGNASKVSTRGIEVELVAQLSENLRLTSAIGLLDATFDDFPRGGKDKDNKTINLAGSRVAGTPDKTFNLGLQYIVPMDSMNSELMFRVDYSYTGKQYIANNNQEEETRTLDNGDVVDYGYLDDISNVNARISLNSNDDDWTVSVWGRNLTDNNNLSFDTNIFSTYLRRDTLPRTYGVEVTYSF